MGIERVEDIIAWQKAKTLTIQIYNLFADNCDFGFKDQIQRTSVSIMNGTSKLYNFPLSTFPLNKAL